MCEGDSILARRPFGEIASFIRQLHDPTQKNRIKCVSHDLSYSSQEYPYAMYVTTKCQSTVHVSKGVHVKFLEADHCYGQF